MPDVKPIMFFAGIALIAWGYYLLAVPPETEYLQVIARVKHGIFSVISGSFAIAIVMIRPS